MAEMVWASIARCSCGHGTRCSANTCARQGPAAWEAAVCRKALTSSRPRPTCVSNTSPCILTSARSCVFHSTKMGVTHSRNFTSGITGPGQVEMLQFQQQPARDICTTSGCCGITGTPAQKPLVAQRKTAILRHPETTAHAPPPPCAPRAERPADEAITTPSAVPGCAGGRASGNSCCNSGGTGIMHIQREYRRYLAAGGMIHSGHSFITTNVVRFQAGRDP